MRLVLLASLLWNVGCAEPGPGPDDDFDSAWGVDVGARQLVVGESTWASSNVGCSGPGEAPMPVVAGWSVSPDGVVSVSSASGSFVEITALATGSAELTASSGDDRRTITFVVSPAP